MHIGNAGADSLAERAGRVLPSGVTHDLRWRVPAGPYFARGRGCRKWDLTGKEYIDYVQGHGALLLGIADPETAEAATEAINAGSHLGGNHVAEVEWAELICEMVPSAEKVRFTSSATEATLLALRLARTFTEKDVVIRFHGHFHGWHDYSVVSLFPPFDVPASPGIPNGVRETVAGLPVDIDALRARLAAGDVAAVIVEPVGSFSGSVPLPVEVLTSIVDVTRRSGALMIFDETVTGFRVAPGGVQQTAGLTADLTVLGKVLAGGLPGGALAGRADVMAPLSMKVGSDWNRFRHVYHPGTFNANPVSAAAGVSVLRRIRGGAPSKEASKIAESLRAGLRHALAGSSLPVAVYGTDSFFYVRLGHSEPPADITAARSGDPKIAHMADEFLLEHGIDTMRLGGNIGTTHDSSALDRTIDLYVQMVKYVADHGFAHKNP